MACARAIRQWTMTGTRAWLDLAFNFALSLGGCRSQVQCELSTAAAAGPQDAGDNEHHAQSIPTSPLKQAALKDVARTRRARDYPSARRRYKRIRTKRNDGDDHRRDAAVRERAAIAAEKQPSWGVDAHQIQ